MESTQTLLGILCGKLDNLLDKTVLDESRDCGIKHASRKTAIYCEIYRGFLIQFLIGILLKI
jgi:hypothetical protein